MTHHQQIIFTPELSIDVFTNCLIGQCLNRENSIHNPGHVKPYTNGLVISKAFTRPESDPQTIWKDYLSNKAFKLQSVFVSLTLQLIILIIDK